MPGASSKNAKLFSGWGGRDLSKLVSECIEEWLSKQKTKRAPSTYRNYKSKSKHVKSKWPRRKIADITKTEIELFQTELLRKSDENSDFADPFTLQELERIQSVKTMRQQDINLAMLVCWRGLSSSELIALSWDDVDIVDRLIYVRRAKVRHRGPNQCRHTFASRMLSNYVSLEWVACQLGHVDTTMVKKHYARWIQSDTPNMAAQVSQMLGFKADYSGQEKPDSAPILPKK